MTVDIDALNTASKVTKYLRSKGFNIIPIVSGTKVPPNGFKLSDYFDKPYEGIINDSDSIALLHGKISGTYAIDIDMKNGGGWEDAIHIVAADIEKILTRTMVVKTPKQGCHFIVKPKGDFPPKNAKYFNKEGIEIDIKTQGGYTLLPPSTHPEKQLGRYQFISETLEPMVTDWPAFEVHLASKGFFTKEDTNNEDMKSEYDISKLMMGKFPRGSRRKCMNSLYCKLRVRGATRNLAAKKIYEVNRKCPEPLTDTEVEHNIKYAESFFKFHVSPTLKDTPVTTKQKKFSPYDAAEQLMNEYIFITHVSGEIYYYSNGIYHKNGKLLISKKCRQHWEVLGIDTATITEIINIIRDKTIVLGEEEDIFDLEHTKLILKNGMYDLKTMVFSDYDSDVISTIKHPIYYDSTKSCPKFDKFIDDCFGGDQIRISQVLEMMALCLIKKYIIQKGYVNYGIGSNGKSTFLTILRNFLGIRNTTSIPMQQFQKSQFVGYEMRGKCANVSADGGVEPITKTGFLKSVLGGDAIRCEQKFRDPFDYMPFITLIFTFNELPIVYDASDGFARKIQTIHWDVIFKNGTQDPNVDRIAYDSDERSGIFNKIIPIAKRLLDTRRLLHESSVEETKATWLSRSDSFYRFKKEHIVVGSTHTIDPRHLELAYSQFCGEEKMTPMPSTVFNEKFRTITGDGPKPTRVAGKQVRVWRGFTLASQLRGEGQEGLDGR